ncbi:MAG: hypothetical protein LAT83_13360 [Kiritimatiellae bacterium]|nr:hypothetical protein [Kiritimatiellia bacterium]
MIAGIATLFVQVSAQPMPIEEAMRKMIEAGAFSAQEPPPLSTRFLPVDPSEKDEILRSFTSEIYESLKEKLIQPHRDLENKLNEYVSFFQDIHNQTDERRREILEITSEWEEKGFPYMEGYSQVEIAEQDWYLHDEALRRQKRSLSYHLALFQQLQARRDEMLKRLDMPPEIFEIEQGLDELEEVLQNTRGAIRYMEASPPENPARVMIKVLKELGYNPREEIRALLEQNAKEP